MDHVTLLAEDGTAVGTLPKSEVHTNDTPLHLAFSCYVLDTRGHLLVTRRSLAKKTWPGVWTNSFCGHPRPDEQMVDAVRRHGLDELGIRLSDVRLAVPDYRYRAVDASGIVENEICPVHVAVIDGQPLADPDEVSEWTWVEVPALIQAVSSTPFAFSPWLVEQLPLLRRLGEV
ncbi:MAG: isopentenyl-diphosphate delta-isomerase [Microbacterium sp.]|jgi:isopentenyl-diphosphate delta-isomerase|uniref:isopentenyl-diphosphate Delta-isomerase n=1 Tax=Microbacterium sp. TaxID=51671 RepID=UPI0026097F7E|nr:isopentenyl-diphosphate Delta-isomerase [Microbacterium sp.]MDF2561107.1 isopentenyl-diphosphate delta-isomerase [Microbacterium sp.]